MTDPAWVPLTGRTALAWAFFAGTVAESALMAFGAVPRTLALGVLVIPAAMSLCILAPAHALMGFDWRGAFLGVVAWDALLFAGIFGEDTALSVDELVLSSQTLTAWCVYATVAMGGALHPLTFLSFSARHMAPFALLIAGTVWTAIFVLDEPPRLSLAPILTLQWVALCIVAACWAALGAADFEPLWSGGPLDRTLLRSFAAGMAFFYALFHVFLFLTPFGAFFSSSSLERSDMREFFAVVGTRVFVRGVPLWLIAALLALQGGAWLFLLIFKPATPPAVMIFLALGFSHVFVIELKRWTRGRVPEAA